MNLENGSTPGELEVLAQVDRILSGVELRKAPIQSELLRFIVKNHLANTPVSAKDLSFALYEYLDPDTNRARSTANIVRNKIATYYRDEGKNDLVQISLLAGPAYKLSVCYHEDAEALKRWRRAAQLKHYGTRVALLVGADVFFEVKRLLPDYAPVYVEMSECYLLLRVFRNIFNLNWGKRHGSNSIFDPSIKEYAVAARSLDPHAVMPHILLAMDSLVSGEWRRAQTGFDVALKLDAAATQSSLWYAVYLMTTVRVDEASRIAELQMLRHPERVGPRFVLDFILYIKRRAGQGDTGAARRSDLNHQFDLHFLLQTLIYLELGIFSEAQFALSRVPEIEREEWEMYSRFMGRAQPKSEWFAGLETFCLASLGESEKAEQKLAWMRATFATSHMQLAIGYMALQRPGRALVELIRARRQPDIFVQLVHLLPLFDPLRAHPRFKKVMLKMRSKTWATKARSAYRQ